MAKLYYKSNGSTTTVDSKGGLAWYSNSAGQSHLYMSKKSVYTTNAVSGPKICISSNNGTTYLPLTTNLTDTYAGAIRIKSNSFSSRTAQTTTTANAPAPYGYYSYNRNSLTTFSSANPTTYNSKSLCTNPVVSTMSTLSAVNSNVTLGLRAKEMHTISSFINPWYLTNVSPETAYTNTYVDSHSIAYSGGSVSQTVSRTAVYPVAIYDKFSGSTTQTSFSTTSNQLFVSLTYAAGATPYRNYNYIEDAVLLC